jgi:CO/xanthine dehydrogenase FAD-binding subunit
MKPPLFDYHRPHDLDETLSLLAEYGDDAKVLAGGQSLVPLLNFRLASPEHLIDINRVPELAVLQPQDQSLLIGATVRQSTLEHSADVQQEWPLLHEVLPWVAHSQIRNRGTIGGSLAHADPAAELPTAMVALDARFHVRSREWGRVIAAADFFESHFTTTLEPDELLVQVEIDKPRAGTGHGFAEFARQQGDFAIGGAMVLVTHGADGTCSHVAIALLAASSVPIRATEVEGQLVGRHLDDQTIADAASTVAASVSPTGDRNASSSYRKHILSVMVRRSMTAAVARARVAAA